MDGPRGTIVANAATEDPSRHVAIARVERGRETAYVCEKECVRDHDSNQSVACMTSACTGRAEMISTSNKKGKSEVAGAA